MSMDKLFKSDEKLYISPAINIKAFLDTALAAQNQLHQLFGCQPGTSQREIFTRFMANHGFEDNTADDTMSKVDRSFKRIYDANPVAAFELTFPPKKSSLLTHKLLHNIREDYDTTAVKNALVLRGKYFKHREQELKTTFAPSGKRCVPDVICTVHLLTPMNRPPETFENFNIRNRCEVRFLVRGDMPLVKLRNKIFCPSDFWCNLEDYESATNQNAYFSNRFPSGFIFVNDTFYVDKRPQCIDISEPIRQFMNRKKLDFGPHKVEDLGEARIADLTVRLGQPYVYQHQGFCEHLLIFTDLRLMTPSDELSVDEYPIRIYDSIQQTMCCTCHDTPAVYVLSLYANTALG